MGLEKTFDWRAWLAHVSRMLATDFDLAYYSARIAALTDKGVYVGTSTWKYLRPRWLLAK